VSPDGHRLAFNPAAEGKQLLGSNHSDALSVNQSRGPTAQVSILSADSRFVGFFQTETKEIDVSGGPPIILTNAQTSGRHFEQRRVIVFAPLLLECFIGSRRRRSIDPVTKLDGTRVETSHRWPSFSRMASTFLYLGASGLTFGEGDMIAVARCKAGQQTLGASSSKRHSRRVLALFRERTLNGSKAFDRNAWRRGPMAFSDS